MTEEEKRAKRNAYGREWATKNPESVRAIKRRCQEKNRQRYNNQRREYRQRKQGACDGG